MVNKDSSLGEIVRSYRKEKGLSAKEFIELLGGFVSPAFITKLEVYGEIPSPELICKIADVIECPAEKLLDLAKESKINGYHDSLEKKYKDALGLYRKQKRKAKN
jgi:transcriptional regulator with XRE-family HTH domain